MTDARSDSVWHALDIARSVASTDGPDLTGLVTVLANDTPASQRAWHVLQHGGLLPRAAVAISRAGLTDQLDARRQETLRTAYEANALRNAVLRRHAICVSRHLNAAGIPVLWTKGLWLAHYIYEQPAMRVMADLDLFVPVGRRSEAVTVLRGHGFAPDPFPAAVGVEAFADVMRPPGGDGAQARDVSIDLHDTVSLSATQIWPSEKLWSEATRAWPGRAEVWLPSPEAALLFAAVHLLKHGLDLRHLTAGVADTLTLLRTRATTFDIDRVARRVNQPFDAAALYVLLSAAGASALPPLGRELLAQSSEAASRYHVRAQADRLIQATLGLRFINRYDFSLFAVGESGLGPGAIARLVRSSFRWRRRVRFVDAHVGRRARSLSSRLTTTNWRYAWTTYLAGRLSGQLMRAVTAGHSTGHAVGGEKPVRTG